MSRQSERKQLQHFEIFTLSENWVNFNARQGESVPISMKNHLIGVASQVQNGDGNGQEKRAEMKGEGGREGEGGRGGGRERGSLKRETEIRQLFAISIQLRTQLKVKIEWKWKGK